MQMDQGFITILQQLIAEQGKEAFLTPSKCKALLADYAKGEYKKEIHLLLLALDAGASKAIAAAEELELCKKQQARILQEERFLTAEAAADIVDTLALVLREEQKSATALVCSNCGKELRDGDKFCSGCGSAVAASAVTDVPPPAVAFNGAAPEPYVTAQPLQSSGNNRIIKQGSLNYRTKWRALKGTAAVYNDRLEWKGKSGMTVVINFSEISSVEVTKRNESLTVTLTNAKEHVFTKTFSAWVYVMAFIPGVSIFVLFYFLFARRKIISELEEWKSAINTAMGRSIKEF